VPEVIATHGLAVKRLSKPGRRMGGKRRMQIRGANIRSQPVVYAAPRDTTCGCGIRVSAHSRHSPRQGRRSARETVFRAFKWFFNGPDERPIRGARGDPRDHVTQPAPRRHGGTTMRTLKAVYECDSSHVKGTTRESGRRKTTGPTGKRLPTAASFRMKNSRLRKEAG